MIVFNLMNILNVESELRFLINIIYLEGVILIDVFNLVDYILVNGWVLEIDGYYYYCFGVEVDGKYFIVLVINVDVFLGLFLDGLLVGNLFFGKVFIIIIMFEVK